MDIASIGFPVLILIVLGFFGCYFLNKVKVRRFTLDILSKLIKDQFGDIYYEPENYLSRDEYRNIGCLNYGDYMTGSDLLILKSINDNGDEVKFSEINTYNKTKKNNATDKTVITTVFKGGIFCFRYHKENEHEVYICSKKGKGKYAFKHGLFKDKKVETENVAFNDMYKIYSDNIESVFYLCSPQMLEQLMTIKEKFRGAVIISFRNGYLYLAISNLDMFKAPVFGIKSQKNIEKYGNKTKEDLQLIIDFINMFKLNQVKDIHDVENEYEKSADKNSNDEKTNGFTINFDN